MYKTPRTGRSPVRTRVVMPSAPMLNLRLLVTSTCATLCVAATALACTAFQLKAADDCDRSTAII